MIYTIDESAKYLEDLIDHAIGGESVMIRVREGVAVQMVQLNADEQEAIQIRSLGH